jgi:hypothetical protein
MISLDANQLICRIFLEYDCPRSGVAVPQIAWVLGQGRKNDDRENIQINVA